MTPIFPNSPRPGRLPGVTTPLAIMAGLIVLLLVPNLLMHTGLRSNANPATSMLGTGAASQSAAAPVQSPPVMR